MGYKNENAENQIKREVVAAVYTLIRLQPERQELGSRRA
jgi:hypothetical protein